jgi:predicted lipid-binding transport protein (Tim44 family)
MNKILLSLVLFVGAFTMIAGDAEAQRMGRRASVGRQSTNVTRQAPVATPSAAPARPGVATPTPMTPPPKPGIPWKGIVGGLVAGALFSSLFSSMGMGGAMSGAFGSMLTFALIGFAVFFLIRMFARRNAAAPATYQPQPAYAGMTDNNVVQLPEIGSRIEQNAQNAQAYTPASGSVNSGLANSASSFGNNPNAGTWTLPADFDVPGFLRHAKANYIRLQAAWDRADINDIREFTSPEMYAELKLQLQERGAAKNETDVVTLEAELLGIETQTYDYLASVKFTGTVKEGGAVNAENFAEVWNLAKPVNGQSGWLLAGIQQLN